MSFFEFWKQKKIDAIISPVTALPAVKNGTASDLILNIAYCFIANAFNLPSGTLPITTIKQEEAHYGPEDCKHRDMFYQKAIDCMRGSEGLPVGVQVMTLPYEDEKCVAIMREIEKEVQFNSRFKSSNY